MYQATLFHPSGDHVTDFRNKENADEVWDEINEMGSRWIFYPIAFVTNGKTVIDTPEGMEFLKNKRVKTAIKFFKNEWNKRADEICDLLNEGIPLSLIY